MTPRGGKRPGSGRPRRIEPKAKGIWVGQIPEDLRQFLLDTLTPDERLQALLGAALIKGGEGWQGYVGFLDAP